VAQNNSGSSCNISLAGQVSVPELCLSVQQAAAQLVSDVVNFTLADNGSIIFEPLPPARVVNVAVNDDSDGLKAWANLANAFVNAVRSGSLPYGNVCVSVVDLKESNSQSDCSIRVFTTYLSVCSIRVNEVTRLF